MFWHATGHSVHTHNPCMHTSPVCLLCASWKQCHASCLCQVLLWLQLTSDGATWPLRPCGRLMMRPLGPTSSTMPHSFMPTDRFCLPMNASQTVSRLLLNYMAAFGVASSTSELSGGGELLNQYGCSRAACMRGGLVLLSSLSTQYFCPVLADHTSAPSYSIRCLSVC